MLHYYIMQRYTPTYKLEPKLVIPSKTVCYKRRSLSVEHYANLMLVQTELLQLLTVEL